MSDAKPALVALRDRREAVIQVLTDSFANDIIDLDTFDERTLRAHQATTVAALDALVVDLEPLPSDARRAPLARVNVDAAIARPRRKNLVAVFSNVERRGAWVVPPALRAQAVFGNVELDFRDASFAPGVTELDLMVVFGNVEIIVPANLAVECEGLAVFASFEHAGTAVHDPDRPLLRIRGSAVFGSVEVSTRLPGESARDAHRRQRRHRRAKNCTAD